MLLFDGGTQRSISNRMTHSCGTVLKDETHFTEAKGAHNVKKNSFSHSWALSRLCTVSFKTSYTRNGHNDKDTWQKQEHCVTQKHHKTHRRTKTLIQEGGSTCFSLSSPLDSHMFLLLKFGVGDVTRWAALCQHVCVYIHVCQHWHVSAHAVSKSVK